MKVGIAIEFTLPRGKVFNQMEDWRCASSFRNGNEEVLEVVSPVFWTLSMACTKSHTPRGASVRSVDVTVRAG